jgi:hypothetical protein
MVANAFIYDRPTVLFGTDDITCHLQMVTLIPDVSVADVETYCNPGGEAPGQIKWAGVLRVRMSYGDEGSWNFWQTLDPATPVEMTIMPSDDTAIASSNPEATLDAYVWPIAFIPEHEVGGSATYDVEFRAIGEPAFDATTA